MNHLFLCREFPPAAYPPGGIGTYVRHIARLLANAGDNVHVIAHRWAGAPRAREELMGGRLIVHRVALDDSNPDGATDPQLHQQIGRGLLASSFPSQAFAWQAAHLAERLIVTEGIDVVEAQEWEAPLYFLQLRRQLGLGPERRPPVVVHLHSSTEQIFAANGWETTVADYGPATAQEAFSITSADALMAPSRFMADQALARYAVAASQMHVIPYPLGDMALLQRSDEIWASRNICHIGRLEPRKGVFECVDALVSIAADYPDLCVDFVGADTPLRASGGPSVAAALRRRIPARFRHQIRFHGSQDPPGVRAVLARATAAVVPSRWENLPYSCIEAMASGLPAVVSPHGGMRELVADGICGWIAETGSPTEIAAALRRALDASGTQRERMGQAAVASVNQKCANDLIVRQHLDLKRQLVRRARLTRRDARVSPPRPVGTSGMAVVVSGVAGPAQLAGVRQSLQAQIESPSMVMVVCNDLTPETIASISAEGWKVHPANVGDDGRPSAMAMAKLLSFEGLLGVVLADAHVQFDPGWLRACRVAFESDERLAVVSPWLLQIGPPAWVRVSSDPARPDLLDDGAPTPLIAVRFDALASAGGDTGDIDWSGALTRVFRSDRLALIYPAVYCSVASANGRSRPPRRATRFSSMAKAIQRLHTPLLQWLIERSPEDRRDFVLDALRNPLQSLRWLARRTLDAASRAPLLRARGRLAGDANPEVRGPR